MGFAEFMSKPYLWGEYGLGGKWLLYEESIRVSLIISGAGIPGGIRGKKLNDLALNIDLAPIVLDMVGIPAQSGMDGKKFVPKFKGGKEPLRSDFFMELVVVIKVEETPISNSREIRSNEWKYILYVNVNPEVEEVYNIKNDPLEWHNLINDKNYVGIRNQLRERYDYYMNKLQKKSKLNDL